jgi:hypothetical protein
VAPAGGDRCLYTLLGGGVAGTVLELELLALCGGGTRAAREAGGDAPLLVVVLTGGVDLVVTVDVVAPAGGLLLRDGGDALLLELVDCVVCPAGGLPAVGGLAAVCSSSRCELRSAALGCTSTPAEQWLYV